MDEEDEETGSRFCFGMLFTIAQILLFGSVAIFTYWLWVHDAGFAWQKDRTTQFNLHAILMVVGFIFFNGQAMLIYKLCNCCKKITTKILHTILFVLSISAIAIGAVAGIQAQDMVPPAATAKHFYSLHAWVGLATMALFALQFVVGFVTFLVFLCCEKGTARLRNSLLPTHRTFGLIIFSLASITCIAGLLQTARARLDGGKDETSGRKKPIYKSYDEPTLMINIVGACIVGLAILIPYMVRNK